METRMTNTGSYFIPREQVHPFFNPMAMRNQEGLFLAWETDAGVARNVLPPIFEPLDPARGLEPGDMWATRQRCPSFSAQWPDLGAQ
jgi:hypothetical protein